ncbi:MAG: PASTA domain-containing protein, partial [Syntrophothermus sp.]
MKNIFENKFVKWFLIGLGSLAVLIILFNMVIMPWYVSGREVVIPKVVGMNEKQAESLLSDSDLEAVVGGERYNENFPKGAVIFQKPAAGATVKEGRRVF